jgi:hypothetical protein
MKTKFQSSMPLKSRHYDCLYFTAGSCKERRARIPSANTCGRVERRWSKVLHVRFRIDLVYESECRKPVKFRVGWEIYGLSVPFPRATAPQRHSATAPNSDIYKVAQRLIRFPLKASYFCQYHRFRYNLNISFKHSVSAAVELTRPAGLK